MSEDKNKERVENMVLEAITDEMVEQMAAKMEMYMKDEREVNFSPEFEAKMAKLIEETDHPYRKRVKKVLISVAAVFVVAIGVGVFFSANGVEAQRIPIISFLFNKDATHSGWEKDPQINNLDIPKEFLELLPAHLPEGLAIVEVTNSKFLTTIYLESGNSKIEYRIFDNSVRPDLDSEDMDYESLFINKTEAKILSRDGYTSIFIPINGYMVTLQSNMALEDLIKIIEDIEYFK